MEIVFFLFIILFCLYFCAKRPGIILAYLLFFQNLNNILFTEVGFENYRYFTSIFFLPIILFKGTSLNSIILKLSLLRKTMFFRGYLLLIFYMLIFSFILSTDYELVYLQKFLFPAFFLCIVAGLLFINPRIYKDFFIGILFFSFFAMVYLITIKGLGSLSDRDFEGDSISAITQGRFAGIMFIFSFFYIFFINLKFKFEKVIGVILLISSIFWLLSTGTRGAAVSSIFCVLFYFLLTKEKLKNLKYILIILLILLPVFNFFQLENSLLFTRIVESENITEMERFTRIQLFFKYLPDYIITGAGPGGWSKQIWGGLYRYPHNIFIEFVIEFGLIGLISFFLIFTGGIKTTIFSIKNGNQYVIPIALGWVFYLISTMFSGGFVQGNEVFFIYSALISSFKKNKNLIT